MAREDLFNYLHAIDDFDVSPLQAVLAQAEVVGEPALPSREDSAALAWVGATYDHWEKHFPLDQGIAISLRRIKPVLGLMALADNQFYTPGVHPLHQALDNLYDAAVGWQDGLGRAGEPVQKLIDQMIEGALACLQDNGAGLMALLRESAKSAQRLQTRTHRMGQRTADAERGQLRAARARETAANMINAQITRHPLPADIGDFLTSHWFESAQLVLLKFGEDSSQWREINAATVELLDTLAPRAEDTPASDPGSQVMQRVRQWLMSLQHDQQLTDEVISAIEFTHLRVAKGVAVDRVATSLIPVSATDQKASGDAELAGIETGQWFLVQARKGGMLRIQLAMMQPKEQRLLFCNNTGARVQSMDYASFADLLNQGKAYLLDTGASFSRSLAAVIGVDTEEAIARLTGNPVPVRKQREAAPVPEAKPSGASRPAPAPAPAPKQAQPRPREEPARATAAAAPQQTPTERPVPPPQPQPQPQTEIEPDELPPVQVASEPPSQPDLPESGIPELPMGTWLGFHDLDPPLLAKLAMHDKVRRLLIFVNRKGIELRRLHEDEYMELLQDGQVDILETKTNFREQVERARQRMARHQT